MPKGDSIRTAKYTKSPSTSGSSRVKSIRGNSAVREDACSSLPQKNSTFAPVAGTLKTIARAFTLTEISEVPLTETSSIGTSIEIDPEPCATKDWSTPRKAVNEEPPIVTVADMLRFAPPASDTVYSRLTVQVDAGTVPGHAESRLHFPICSEDVTAVSNEAEEDVSDNKSSNGDSVKSPSPRRKRSTSDASQQTFVSSAWTLDVNGEYGATSESKKQLKSRKTRPRILSTMLG